MSTLPAAVHSLYGECEINVIEQKDGDLLVEFREIPSINAPLNSSNFSIAGDPAAIVEALQNALLILMNKNAGSIPN